MTDSVRRAVPRRALLLAGIACLSLAGCGSHASTTTSSTTSTSRTSTDQATPSPSPSALGSLVSRLSPWSADLRSKPVAIPLRFQAPTIGVDIAMDAVGLTSKNAMDAPEGNPNDPIWNTGFWYRGGVEPGQPGVSTIAGHLDDTLGRPAAFWNLRKLQPGDMVQVLDTRTGEVVHFKVTDAHVYNLADSSTRPVLNRLFGSEAAVAQEPAFPSDGIARLSLVTCAGVFTRGEYDHRYMVFAERVDGPGSPGNPASPAPQTAAAATST